MKKILIGTAVAVALFSAVAAHADPVSATLSATYFEVLGNSGDPDFNIFNTPNVAAGSSLGANGMPVVTAPFGINDVGPGNQITWWDPALNSNVVQTGTGTISLPYSSNMYPPNSTGGDDGTGFETAVFTGTFNLSSAGTVGFDLGSDDDSFIYVDGTLFGQNPGVHGVSTVDFTSPELTAGNHNIEIFYDDRHQTGAFLSLSLDATSSGITVTPGVPEPAAWAMMVLGLGAVGGVLRSRRKVALSLA